MVRLRPLLALLGCAIVIACGGTEGTADSATDTIELEARRLDSAQVPADLAHLILHAERWGIGDDVERNARVDRATAAERQVLRSAIEPHHARITAWLDSFGQRELTAEAAAFMYMQLALDEMGPPGRR